MEPAERQEKIPTESQKEKERGRGKREREIARGMKAYCGLERNYCNGGREGREGVKTRRLKEGERKKELQQSSRGPGEKEIFRTVLMREMNDERCNKKIRGERDRRRRKTGRERGEKGGRWLEEERRIRSGRRWGGEERDGETAGF